MDFALIGIVLALVPLVVARPFAGAVLYTALAYLRPQNLVGGFAAEMRLSMIVLVATCVGLLLARIRGKERPLFATPWFAIVLALVAVEGVAVRTAVFPALAQASWLDFLRTLAGVGVTVALCTTWARARTVLLTATVSLGLMTVASVAFPTWEESGRLAGGGGHFRDSNDFALALAMALPLLLCGWRVAVRRSVRLLLLALVPVVIVAAVLTQSRGGFLAIAVVLGAWALTTRGRVFKLALAPAAALLFLAAAPARYVERITTLQDFSHDESARDRISSWKVATRIAQDRPLTGVGPGNFLAVYPRYSNDFRSPHVAHNTPLQLLADAGAFALAAFLALLGSAGLASASFAMRARQRRRVIAARGSPDRVAALNTVDAAGTGIALALLGYFVGSQFLSRDDMDLFYLLTGIAFALRAHARPLLARAPRPLVRGHVVEAPCVSAA